MERIAAMSERVIRIGFVLLFILVPLILTPWNYELFEYNKMMVTYGLTVLIVGAWIINMVAAGEIRIRRTPLDIPILLFVLSQLISTLFSMDPHVSWFGYYSRFNGGMLSVFTYVALYYAFVSNFSIFNFQFSIFNKFSKKLNDQIKNHASINSQSSTPAYPSSVINRLIPTILITGFIISLYGIAEHFGIDKHLWVQDVENRVFSTLGQPNWLAAYLIALCPIAWGFALWKMENGKWKMEKNHYQSPFFLLLPLSSIFYFLLSIIFFLTLLWTRSRSGFMALAAADVVFWGIIFLNFIRPRLKPLADIKGEAFKKFTYPFLFIHLAFLLIIVINGVYVKQIDDWITIKAWQQRISNITTRLRQGSGGQVKQLNNGTMEQPASPRGESNNEEKSEEQQNAQQPQDTKENTKSKSPLIESGVTDSGDIRKYVWQGAINAWISSPKTFLIGTGTETYAFAFYQYKPIGHNLTSEWDFLYNKAHNEYLNFLATTGVFGLGTYLLLIGSFIYWFIKSQITNHNFQRNYKYQTINIKPFPDEVGIIENLKFKIENLHIGLFSGWLSVLITNFFGFSVVITQIFFYLFPAMIFAVSSEKPTYLYFSLSHIQAQTKKRVIWITTVLSILLVCVFFVMWLADKHFARGYNLSRAGYLPQAYQALSSAISLNPTEPLYHDEQGNVLSTLALSAWKENQATMSQELATLSIRENNTALAISPKNVNFWKSRTKIYYALSSIDPLFFKEAITALEKGLTLSPLDPKMYYNLAILYGTAGFPDRALELMKKSVELKPNYREGYFGVYLLYKEGGMTYEAYQIIQEYLTKVDPTDKEFLELIQ
ncbi:MAG: TPR Domain containing protein [Candidatus Gottesmanbacteria bacterium GW2011_GWB1_44_11c]|uniref:TPR Domain containing protein n=1 Tax=Candidatus Gottesmanbacteria bacterium GW2011_GWB1_44_11c TaxID=1618447 RepID=A0A0G1ITN2_9BACT|nr:MAG: TPR Domain containing protein [Candidatus Gottesmanbacteria bacterium GW2011_GWB1_44_11c]